MLSSVCKEILGYSLILILTTWLLKLVRNQVLSPDVRAHKIFRIKFNNGTAKLLIGIIGLLNSTSNNDDFRTTPLISAFIFILISSFSKVFEYMQMNPEKKRPADLMMAGAYLCTGLFFNLNINEDEIEFYSPNIFMALGFYMCALADILEYIFDLQVFVLFLESGTVFWLITTANKYDQFISEDNPKLFYQLIPAVFLIKISSLMILVFIFNSVTKWLIHASYNSSKSYSTSLLYDDDSNVEVGNLYNSFKGESKGLHFNINESGQPNLKKEVSQCKEQPESKQSA